MCVCVCESGYTWANEAADDKSIVRKHPQTIIIVSIVLVDDAEVHLKYGQGWRG